MKEYVEHVWHKSKVGILKQNCKITKHRVKIFWINEEVYLPTKIQAYWKQESGFSPPCTPLMMHTMSL